MYKYETLNHLIRKIKDRYLIGNLARRLLFKTQSIPPTHGKSNV